MTTVNRLYTKIIELAFDIEHAINFKSTDKRPLTINTHNPNDVIITKLYFHFKRNSIIKNSVYPYALVFMTSDAKKYRYTLKDIVEVLHYIPLYTISNTVIAKLQDVYYAFITIDDKISPVHNSCTAQIKQLKLLDNESIQYERTNGLNNIDPAVLIDIKNILSQHGIAYHENENGIVIYDDTAYYNIIIPNNLKTTSMYDYCIIPSITPFARSHTISIGEFSLFNKHDASLPLELNYAIIRNCPQCHKNILCDYLEYGGTICPYCNHAVYP